MATLNKIREKQGLLVAVIGLALLLFILMIGFGDMNVMNTCSRSNSTTEFSAGGVNVDRADVDKILNRYTENADKSKLNTDQLRQSILVQLAQQALVNKECKSLGITPAPTLLGQMMEYDQQFASELASIMASANPPVQIVSMQQAKALIDNPKGQDPVAIAKMKEAWVAREQEITDQYNLYVFSTLVDGLFAANNLDAKSLYTDNNTFSSVTYVSVAIPADTVKATEADKKAVYDDLKWQFYVPAWRAKTQPYNPNQQPTTFFEEPVRVVDVAAVVVQPSIEDKAKTYTEFSEFISQLGSADGHIAAPQGTTQQPVGGFAYALGKNTQLQQTLGLDAEALAQVLAADTIYSRPSTAADMQHVALAVSSIEERVDSVQASFRLALGAAPADSVEASQIWIIPGSDNQQLLYTLANQYQTLIPNLESDAAVQAFQQMYAKVNDLALSADVNAPVEYVDSVNNIHVAMTVDKRNPKTPYVTGTLYTAQAVPSSQTLFDLRERLLNVSTSTSAEALVDSVAAKRGVYNDMVVSSLQIVSGSSPYISLGASTPVENSRQAIKWAMDKKVGDISPLFENNDLIYVVAIREAINDNFIPMTSPLISSYIDYRANALKNGNKMIENYSGATLAELAKSMGEPVITDNHFNLNGRTTLSLEPQLSGKVAGAQPGQVVGPIVVGDQIFAFSVVERKEPTSPFVASNYTRAFVNDYSPANDLFLMLAGKGKVKNYGIESVASDEDLERMQNMQPQQKK